MEENAFHLGRFSLITTLLNVLNENASDSSNFALASYFLRHFNELDRLNIYDVAEDCFVSRSGVQRFCKSIGFDTFSGLKSSSPTERIVHQNSFIAFAKRPDFPAYVRGAMQHMLADVQQMAERQDLPALARQIHDSRNVVFLTAEYSSMGPRDLQQAMIVAGRLTLVVTDSHPDYGLLDSLTEQDLIIVCSATGSYAYAVRAAIARQGAVRKILISFNRDPLFRQCFDQIYFLSGEELDDQRSVYTKYGLSCFLDLLYHNYLRLYYGELGPGVKT